MTDALAPTSALTASIVRRSPWRLRLAYSLYRAATRLRWAEPEINGLARLVPADSTVLDVGAALGMYTVPLAHLTGPGGRVYSFEPQPRGVAIVRLLRVLTGARHGATQRLALGPRPGEGTIAVPFINGFPVFGHGHVAEGAAAGGRRMQHTATRIDTIDAWCQREGVERVAFIKIDVEGFEPSVLEGARGVIDRDRPSLLLEIEDRHLSRYGRESAGFLAEMRERWPDYRLYRWSGREWSPAERVDTAARNYLFATDSVLAAASPAA